MAAHGPALERRAGRGRASTSATTASRVLRRAAVACHSRSPRSVPAVGLVRREREASGREVRACARPTTTTTTTTTTGAAGEASTSYGGELTERALDPSAQNPFPTELPRGTTKREVSLLVRSLAQSNHEEVWPRAELMVTWLESQGGEARSLVDAWMYTEVLRSFRKRGQAGSALRLYGEAAARRPRLRLDSHFYAETMLALSKGDSKHAAAGEDIWNDLLRRSNAGLVTKYALTSFLCCCARSGDWRRALRAFHTDFYILQTTEPNKKGVALPDVVACTALMKALRAGGQWHKGERLLQWMYENGIEPNAYTFAELIQLLGDCGKWELVLSHYYEMTSSKSERESPSRRLRAPTANAHVFSATMNALCQSNKHDECREVWGKMISQGIEPTAITLVSLLKILERKHDGRRALEYFRLVQNRNEAEINIVVYNVVLSALSKSECAGEAKEIFEEILESRRVRPDRVTYETMVAAYAHVGDYRRADEFFRRMKFASYQPSDYAYVGRIKAYAKNDMWRECVSILKEVEQEDGVQPSVHVYNAVLQACFVTRKWELALKLFARMEEKKIEPNASTRALLSKICNEAIETCEDRQRQAATLSAIAAAAGALAIRTGVF